MRISLSALSAALILMGCSVGGETEQSATSGGDGDVAATVSGGASSGSATASAEAGKGSDTGDTSAYSYAQSNDLYDYSYSFPAVPQALNALLRREADSAEARLKANAEGARKEAEASDYPYRTYEETHKWQKVASIPGYLSLSEDMYVFSGGAHGMSGFDSLVWDRAAGTERKPIDLFTSPAALSSAIRKAFCAKLDAERARRRGGDVSATGDGFSDCIDPLEQTLILGSSNGTTFDRMGFLIGPYAAGPYAEGTYEITLPVSEAVLAQVKPGYADIFSVMR